MQPDKPKNAKPPSFLGCFTVFVLLAGGLLAPFTKIEAVLVLGGLLWFAVALPYSLVVGMVHLGRASGSVPRIAPKPAPVKSPGRAERMAEARERYEATIAMLEGSGLDHRELNAAKRKAKAQYLREIDSVMGGR